jgi:hypothetical protein
LIHAPHAAYKIFGVHFHHFLSGDGELEGSAE